MITLEKIRAEIAEFEERIADLPNMADAYAAVWHCLDIIDKYAEQEQTGHWILDETDNSITCDKCGCLIWANDISNGEAYYCPNCGARMAESEG